MMNILKIGNFLILCFVCAYVLWRWGRKHPKQHSSLSKLGETTVWSLLKVNNGSWSRHTIYFYCTQYEQFSKTVPNTYVCVRDSFQPGKLSTTRTVFVNGTYCAQCRLIGSLRLIGTSPSKQLQVTSNHCK